jgi:hypothetical protein
VSAYRFVAALSCLMLTAGAASAQEPAVALPAAQQVFVTADVPATARPKRPKMLIPLYALQLSLHGLDVHSSLQALERGHREANPLLRNATSGQMIGAKLASSAASVWVAERLWKKNRPAAMILMAAVNVGLAAVVANNYRIARR